MRRARGAHTQDRSRLATDIKTLTLGGSHKPTADGVTGVGTSRLAVTLPLGTLLGSSFLGMRPKMDSIPISFRFYGVNVL
jgi:hypothetical protein